MWLAVIQSFNMTVFVSDFVMFQEAFQGKIQMSVLSLAW